MLVDRRPRLVMSGAAALMAIALAALGLGAHLSPIATTAIALWGFALASLPVSPQTAVLRLGATAPTRPHPGTLPRSTWASVVVR